MEGGKLKRAMEVLIPPLIIPMCCRLKARLINGARRRRVFRIAPLLREKAAARAADRRQLLSTETPHPRVSCMTPEGAIS